MNDRFKFRIAVFERYNTNEWEFTKFIENSNKFGISTNGNIIQENVNGFIIHLPREKTPENVYRTIEAMQSTGLKDKNGTLIYEGDIVKYTSKKSKTNPEKEPYTENYQVVWEEKYTGYNLQSNKKVNCFNLGIMTDDIEVIGNIYENKELLT